MAASSISCRLVYLASSLFAVIAGCTNSVVTPPPANRSGLLGTWNWARSINGVAGATPALCHCTRALTFNSDSTYLTSETFLGVKVEGSGRYTLYDNSSAARDSTASLAFVVSDGKLSYEIRIPSSYFPRDTFAIRTKVVENGEYSGYVLDLYARAR
jgi:hypothetical protein